MSDDREKQFSLRLSGEELTRLHELARAHDRSANSLLRSLIRQAWNKTTIDLSSKKKAAQHEAEYV